MNPVSTRGRSMSRDRRIFRAPLASAGLLCLSLTTGCLRSAMVRPGDGPVSQSSPSTEPTSGRRSDAPAAPIPRQGGDLSGNPIGGPLARQAEAPPADATPPGQPQAGTPQQIQSASDSSGRQPEAVTPAITEPVSETPAANPTPLLDAAIERVAAVTRQDESLDSGTATSPSVAGAPRAGGQANGQTPPTGDPLAAPLQPSETPRPVEGPVSSAAIMPSVIKHNDPPALADVSAVSKAETPPISMVKQPKIDLVPQIGAALLSAETSAHSDERAHAAIDVTKPDSVGVEPDPLGINKLCLCRKVLGFGSFEALADTRVKAGQRLLVYCEMTGMQYEEKHSEFVSRLSSRIEITSITNGTIVWMHELGPAGDVCGSRRRDFYVNYRVDLPSSLRSGLYSLRLTQNDLVAQRSTSAEIPLEIVP
jgi:hypothetical protein